MLLAQPHFAGNATLIGASANIVTATLAERAGEKISFVGWLKGGVLVTVVSGRGSLNLNLHLVLCPAPPLSC